LRRTRRVASENLLIGPTKYYLIILPLYLSSLTETDNTGWERSATLDKALACAFICIEAERKKEKGFLFKQPEEVISFMVQVLWPFALVERPSGKKVIFDSLAVMKRQIYDGNVGRGIEFVEQIKECAPSSISRSEFHKRLQRYTSYFKDFVDSKMLEIPGCLPDNKIAEGLTVAFSSAGPKEQCESVDLSPIIDTGKVKESLSALSELKAKSQGDIQTLNKSPLPLNSVMPKWHKQIDDEIKQVKKTYNALIEDIRPDVAEKISELTTLRERELAPLRPIIERLENETRVWEDFKRTREAEESRARADEIKAEGDLEQAEEEVDEANQELQIAQRRANEDQSYQQRYDEEWVSQIQRRITRLENKVSDAEDTVSRARPFRNECMERTYETSAELSRVEGILNQKRDEYGNIEDHYERVIADQERRITALEDRRDSEVESLSHESSILRDNSKEIREDIKKLIRRKELVINQIDGLEMHIPIASLKPETESYIYVPFFLALLKSQSGSRFLVIPPSRARKSKSTVEKISQFLMSKIPIPSEPRNHHLTQLSSELLKLLTTTNPISKELFGKAQQSNLLNSSNTRDQLLKGIQGLCTEGFLSEKVARKLMSTFPMNPK